MTVSQIVKTAENKADVKNTDFITYEDKLNILNDAYRQVYQESINAGEQFFLKKINISHGQKLPEDFWTIQEVFDSTNTIFRSRIPRLNASNLCGYDIVNDKFVLRGYRSAELIYNPKPVYLTFPGKAVKTKLRASVNVVDYYKDRYLTSSYDAESGRYEWVVYQGEATATNTIGSWVTDYSVDAAFIRQDYVVFALTNTVRYVDFNGNTIKEVGDSAAPAYPILGIDEIFFAYNSDILKSIYNIDDVEMFLISAEAENLVTTHLKVYSEYTNKLYVNEISDKNYLTVVDSDGAVTRICEITNSDIFLLHYDDAEWVYYNINGIPHVVTDQGDTTIKREGRNAIGSTDDYLAIKDGYWTHFSPVPDTDISWPNNAYYTYLSALVALEFIKRLEGNIDSINIEVEEERFWKTIHRDNSQYVVIKDNGYFG